MWSDDIRMIGLGLSVGETANGQLCPFCGAEDDKQLSVTRTEAGLLYICFRASCGKSGLVASSGGNFTRRTGSKFSPKYYKYPTTELSPEQKQFFYDSWGIEERELVDNRFVYNQTKNTFAYPIFDSGGDQFGIVDRSYNGRKPKAISYFEKDREKLHFPRTEQTGDTCVIVEDHLSAIKVARHSPSVALLGCSWGNKEQKLLSYMYSRIILALDPKTEQQALRLRRKFSLDYKSFDIRILDKDPKDMTDQEIKDSIL